jgi:hypothetical protein
MRLCVIISVLGFSAAANAGSTDLPCVAAESALRSTMTDPLNQPTPEFLACLRTSRVCVLSMSGDEVWASNSIREIPESGQAALGIVQTAPSDAPALCLAGIYSGGSAAAWLFTGWRVDAGKPLQIRGMWKANLNSDSVFPRGLANEIYRAYLRFGR